MRRDPFLLAAMLLAAPWATPHGSAADPSTPPGPGPAPAFPLGASEAGPAAPSGVYHEPQVRYLIADIQLGGSSHYYRRWAVEEKDPDSIRALVEWEAGTRLLRPELYERIDVEFAHGKGKRIEGKTVIAYKDTDLRIDGADVRLQSDDDRGRG